METRLTLKPGQRGTKKLQAQYGDRLVCVRYRYDEEQGKRYKTIELIISVASWSPPRRDPIAPETVVLIKVAWGEPDLARRIKAVGGVWNRSHRAWELRYEHAVALDLNARILRTRVGKPRKP